MAPTKPSAAGSGIRTWLIISFIALGIGFVVSAAMGVIAPETFLDMPVYWVAQLLLWVGTGASFTLAILHLIRFREKGMAVTFLVLSSVVLFILIISFLAGVMIALAEIA